MFTKAFAMIAGANDNRIVIDAGFLQKCEPVGQCGVGIRDFAVVQVVFIFLRERRRGFVRIMRVVQVNPDEMRTSSMFFKPTFGVGYDIHAAAFDASPAWLVLARGILTIVFRKVVVE